MAASAPESPPEHFNGRKPLSLRLLFFGIGIGVGAVFLAALIWLVHFFHLKADFTTHKAAIVGDMAAAIENGDPSAALAIGKPYQSVGDYDFRKVYADATDALSGIQKFEPSPNRANEADTEADTEAESSNLSDQIDLASYLFSETVDSDPTEEKEKVPVAPDLPVALNEPGQPTELLRPDEKRGSVTDPEKGNEAETPKKTAIAIGETFQLGDFSYTIGSASKTRAIAGSRIEAAQIEAFEDELETNPERSDSERAFYEMVLWQMKESGQGTVASDSAAFLIVRYEIKNEATTAKTVSTIDFTIVDYKNRQYKPSSAAISELTLNQGADFLLSELQPGIAREGVQAFELPIDSFDEDLTLVVPEKGWLSSKKTSVIIPSETFHRGARRETKGGTQASPADERDRRKTTIPSIKGDLAKVNSKIESERARWRRATEVINTLTNFKRTPVREGSPAYHQCVEASKIITEVEQGAAALKAEKARLEAILTELEEQ